jgi:acyl-CoA thioester hydrolase
MKTRIHYHHTDCGGVVYYARYLDFMEEARAELFESMGFSVKGLMEQGVLFAVARQEVDYKRAAVYGDTVQTRARVEAVSGARVEFSYELDNQDGVRLVEARTVLVCVGTNLKPRRVPEEIAARLIPARS